MSVGEIVALVFTGIAILIFAVIFIGVAVSMQNDLDGTEGWFQRKPKDKED